MKLTRTGKRRAAAIKSVKILLTSASLAATVGGWAAISAANGSTLQVAQVDATATVQSWLDSRAITATGSTTGSATTAGSATATSAASTTGSSGTTQTGASTAPTQAATATAVPTQVVVQPTIHTHSSR